MDIPDTIYLSKYCHIQWIDATLPRLETGASAAKTLHPEVDHAEAALLTPLHRMAIIDTQFRHAGTLRVTALNTPIYMLGYISGSAGIGMQSVAAPGPFPGGAFTGAIRTTADVRIPPGQTILVVTSHPVPAPATDPDRFTPCPVPLNAEMRMALELIMAQARILSGQTLTPALAKACEWGLASLLGIVADDRPGKRSAGEAVDLLYQEVLLDIQANCWRHDFSIGQVAQRHKINVRTLQKMFQNRGTTPKEYITAARLQMAHRALLDPAGARKKICDIAYESGFSSIATFNRLFHERFGQSPSTMRTSMRALA